MITPYDNLTDKELLRVAYFEHDPLTYALAERLEMRNRELEDLDRPVARTENPTVPMFNYTPTDLIAMADKEDAFEIACAKALTKLIKSQQELAEAMQDLLDEQNGPPLLRTAHSWQTAVARARAAINNVTE